MADSLLALVRDVGCDLDTAGAIPGTEGAECSGILLPLHRFSILLAQRNLASKVADFNPFFFPTNFPIFTKAQFPNYEHCVSLHMYVHVSRGFQRLWRLWIPCGTAVTSVIVLCNYWDLDLSSVQDQHALLTAEPSL